MKHHDTVDRTIRNQRYRGWPLLLWLFLWGLSWMGSAILLERWFSPTRASDYLVAAAWLCWVILMLITYIMILVRIGRLPPKRIKLGEEMWPVPGARIKPKDIGGFHFERDPDEDYVETKLPIPVCQLTIEMKKRKRRMIVTLGDATRVHEWAVQHGVPVYDPEGYASRIHVPETRQ